jgi:antitoxin (DNA-binding transcriptional repressor) of toxin-antitoxin stability system
LTCARRQLVVTVAEAQDRLEELIDLVRAGGSVIIADPSTPPIELVPIG